MWWFSLFNYQIAFGSSSWLMCVKSNVVFCCCNICLKFYISCFFDMLLQCVYSRLWLFLSQINNMSNIASLHIHGVPSVPKRLQVFCIALVNCLFVMKQLLVFTCLAVVTHLVYCTFFPVAIVTFLHSFHSCVVLNASASLTKSYKLLQSWLEWKNLQDLVRFLGKRNNYFKYYQ